MPDQDPGAHNHAATPEASSVVPSDSKSRSRSREAYDAELAKSELPLLQDANKIPPLNGKPEFDYAHSLSGISFSGGGIRSAAFNLGLVQSLLKTRLFAKLHYICTVSGGGYLGSLLSAHAANPRANAPANSFPQKVGGSAFDTKLLDYVRGRSSYLTPTVSNQLLDWLNLILEILKGLVAHLLLAGLTLGAAVVPFFIIGPERILAEGTVESFLAMALPVTLVCLGVMSLLTALTATPMFQFMRRSLRLASAFLVALLVIEGVLLLNFWLQALLETVNLSELRGWIVGGTGTGGSIGAFLLARKTKGEFGTWPLWRKVSMFLAPYAVLLGFAFFFVWLYEQSIHFAKDLTPDVGRLLFTIAWFVAIGIGALSLAQMWGRILISVGKRAALKVKLLKQPGITQDPPVHASYGFRRLLLTALALVMIFVLPCPFPWLCYGEVGEPSEERAREVLISFFLVGAMAVWLIWGVAFHASRGAGKLAFVYVLLLLCHLLTTGRFVYWLCVIDPTKITYGGMFPFWVDDAYWRLYLLVLLLLLLFFLFFNLNSTSLHAFYRDKLADVFLSDPDTGHRLPDLSLDVLAENTAERQFPYHIIASAVNLPKDDNRILAGRRVDSFIFTGRAIGGESTFGATESKASPVLPDPAKYATWDEPIDISGAMAISGAAVNSHLGSRFPGVVSALMTLLNARLGYWLPNPSLVGEPPKFQHRDKPIWPDFFLKELLSSFDRRTRRVLLSDGGHFENLGLYELVRRKCRYIIVSDAGADPNLKFEDLGNAVRRCRVDFDVEIDLGLESLERDVASGMSSRHVVVGSVVYPGNAQGVIVYIKSTLTGDEPADVLQYHREHPSFPHEPTSDQFFDEAQFESYRKLGEHVGRSVFAEDQVEELDGFFVRLRERWRAPAADAGAGFLELAREFMAIEASGAVQEPNTLDAQQYPEFFKQIPSSDPYKALHHITRQFQFIENVWLKIRLDDPKNRRHPDNRGCMNTFKRWAKAPIVRGVYPVLRSIYGKAFQRFCESQLDLPTDEACLTYTQSTETRAKDVANCEHFLKQDALWPRLSDLWSKHAENPQVPLHLLKISYSPLDGREEELTVGCALELGTSSSTGYAELFAFVVDDRFYHCGLPEYFLSSMIQEDSLSGRDLLLFPFIDSPDNEPCWDESQWEGVTRYLQQLGFVPDVARERNAISDPTEEESFVWSRLKDREGPGGVGIPKGPIRFLRLPKRI